MSKADLHMHSKYSNDGEYEVSDLIDKCIKNAVDIFSLTDHNSVGGINEAVQISTQRGISFIPAIEIDCIYKGTDLHMLGYNIDWESEAFKELEDEVSKKVIDAFSLMVENLNKLGIEVDVATVLEKANGGLPSGELIAEVLLNDKTYHNDKLLPYMEGGNRSDMPYLNFYMDFFAQGKPAYVKIDYMDYTDALKLVKENGGVPIIAHPGLNFKGREEIVEELLDLGAEGLEIFNNYHNQEQMEYFAATALQWDAIMTCGSDFHGKTKPIIDIGNYRFDEKYVDYLADSVQRLL